MSDTLFIAGMGTVVVLVGFLIAKHAQRVHQRAQGRQQIGFVPSSFDPTPIQPRVQRLRQNFEAEVRPPGELETSYHLSLLASFREAVARSAYFQEREAHQ